MVMHLANDHIALKFNAHLLQAVDLLLHDGLGQTELRDAVHQHAAGHMQGLVNGDLVAKLWPDRLRRSGRQGLRR